jgi:PilZ domain
MGSGDDAIRDRRACGRIPVELLAEVRDLAYSFQAQALDLSSGGMRVRVAGSPPGVGSDVEITLRPPSEPAVELRGRVVHVRGDEAGIAFALERTEIFEAALNLYETALMRAPAQAIRLKQRPTSLPMTQRLWPREAGDMPLSSPERRVLAILSGTGTTLADIKHSAGAQWAQLKHVPFMLVERGLASLSGPATYAPPPRARPESGALPAGRRRPR